jgi:hypothetical protein
MGTPPGTVSPSVVLSEIVFGDEDAEYSTNDAPDGAPEEIGENVEGKVPSCRSIVTKRIL